MTPRIYKKGTVLEGGTVSIANGASTFTGTGTLFGGADLEGAVLFVFPTDASPVLVGVVAAIDPRYPEGTYPNLGPIALTFPWEGDSIVEQPYLLLLSAATVPSSLATALFGRYVEHLERNAALFFDGRDTPVSEITSFVTRALYYDDEARILKSWRAGQFESLEIVGSPFNPRGPWDRPPIDKTALAISTGEVDIDFDAGALDVEGARHFSLEVDGAAEFQPPTNVEVGSRILIKVTIDGGPHAITFDPAFLLDPEFDIESADNAVSLVFMEVTEESAGTATEILVSRFPYAKNDLVSYNGFVFVSNMDGNTAEPEFDGPDPVSNSFWTRLPAVIGDRGATGLAGFAYDFDDSTAMDSNPDPGSLRVDDADLAFVEAINFALVDEDGINRQDQFETFTAGDRIEIKSRDGDAIFAEYTLTGVGVVTSSRIVFPVALVDKMSAFADAALLDVVFRKRGPEGAAGTDPGGLFTWDDANTDDPASGQIRASHDDLSAATVIYVSELNRNGDDLSNWLGSFADSTSAVKGTITLTRSGGNAQAMFDVTGITVEADSVTLAVTNHSGATGFVDGNAVSLQFARTGNDGVVVGDVSSVNGESGDVVLTADDIETVDVGDPGDTIEDVLDDHDGRIVDLEADIDGKVDEATFNANTILKADSDNTPVALTVAEQRLVGRITAGVITALTASEVRTLLGLATGDSPQLAGVNVGHASDTLIARAAAGIISVAGIPHYPHLPPQNYSAAHTMDATDANRVSRHPAADTNNRTFTIDSNTNLALPIGTFFTFINEVNTLTIAITSDTLVWAPTGSTGSRSLAAHGIATAIKVDTTRWYISGVGLT